MPEESVSLAALEFRHDNETAQPNYYGVTFENGMRTEFAPTDHAAVFRFTFTGDAAGSIGDGHPAVLIEGLVRIGDNIEVLN